MWCFVTTHDELHQVRCEFSASSVVFLSVLFLIGNFNHGFLAFIFHFLFLPFCDTFLFSLYSLSVCLHNVFNTHEVKFIFIDLDIILYFSNMMKENARQGFTEKLPSKMARLVSTPRQIIK